MIRIINTAEELRIELMGDIGQSLWSDGWTLERFKAEVADNAAPRLVIDLKSLGGDVMEAYAIHDAIKAMPARVTVNIVGSSASAATIIAAAADEVTISENSRYLVHNARTWAEGTAEQLGQAYEMLRSIDEQIVNTYIKRTGKARAAIEELMKQERWMTAAEAVEWGFVDKIIKPIIENKMTQEEIDALTAENEQLKAQIAELQKVIQEMQMEKEEIEAAEIEKELDEKVAEGRITNEVRAFWAAAYKQDRKAAQAAIAAIPVPTLANVPKPSAPVNKAQAWEDYKAGKITAEQYLNLK
jgi:ATP-dependent protease ClpP protease subunit